ncbi:helix-turn-helix transcriptional regulator [Sulfobacillus sp. DSM 109850]|uniref:Helix-turn-helix transcriptional regulator n=2 Tax=Sulfobacillus harzensis TaxID=2729629 RepID=A0A7Y0L3H6_9FIRM|nr:helix-turn-helix transcriptional regulator [Sulfobacillus harzensis]
MTQADLAKGLFDRSYISQIESGVVVPPLSTLKVLSERLHVPLGEIVDADHSEKAALVRHGHKLRSEGKKAGGPDQLYLAWELFMEGQAANSDLLGAARDFLSIETGTERALYVLQRSALRLIQSENIGTDDLTLLIQLGNAYFTLSRFLDALAVYETVLEFNPEPATRLRALGNMGSTLYLLNRHEQAFELYTTALELAEQTNNVEMMARCHHGLGIVARALGDLERAHHHTVISAMFYQGIDEMRGFGAKQNLGVILREQEKYSVAEPYLNECLEAYRSRGHFALAASVLEELARLQLARGLAQEALSLCHDGIDYIFRTDDVKQLVRLLYLKATILCVLENSQEAGKSERMAEFLAKALRITVVK